MAGVFISYRREDSAGHTGRLFDRLRTALGRDRVFMDVTGIEAGIDFVETIEQAIGSCEVLLAVIGPDWLTCTNRGQPRLQDPDDFIRIEISAALRRQIRVIPVLIAGASMPPAEALPDDLKPLARRQAAEVRDTRWDADTDDLIALLERVLGSRLSGGASREPHGRRESPAATSVGTDRRRLIWRWAAAAAAILLIVAAAIAWDLLQRPDARDQSSTAAAADTSRAQPEAAEPPKNDGGAVSADVNASPDASPSRTLPRLVGRTLDDALEELRTLGLEPGSRIARATDKAPLRQVLDQNPRPGTVVDRGARVDLVYAEGLPRLTIPNIVGTDVKTAMSMLERAGLVVTSRRSQPTTGVPMWQVISQEPPAGTAASEGDGVAFVYATTPALEVPPVTGLAMREALATLERAGFKAQVTRELTARVPAGTVMQQLPASGTKSTGDRPVVITVATDPTPAVALIVRYQNEPDRETARLLVASVRSSVKVAEARMETGRGAPSVTYHAPEFEGAARNVAARTASWLSQHYGVRVDLKPALRNGGTPTNAITIWLPLLPTK